MAQGKLKAKTKLPKNVQKKKNAKKGSAITKRASECFILCYTFRWFALNFLLYEDHPIQPKKKGIAEAKKLKQIIHKTVNKAVEEEIRSRASDQSKSLSAAQKAVAEYNKKNVAGPS